MAFSFTHDYSVPAIRHRLSVVGRPGTVVHFVEKAHGPIHIFNSPIDDKGKLDAVMLDLSFNEVVPIPIEVLTGKIDFNDPIYWETKKWGVRYGALDSQVVFLSDTCATYMFTAFGIPRQFFLACGAIFPDLVFFLSSGCSPGKGLRNVFRRGFAEPIRDESTVKPGSIYPEPNTSLGLDTQLEPIMTHEAWLKSQVVLD